MKLYQNTLFGLRYKQWTYLEAFAYCLKGVMRELRYCKKIASKAFVKKWLKQDGEDIFLNCYNRIASKAFVKKWLKRNGEESYFDFNGAKLPDISNSCEKFNTLRSVFDDVFMVPCFFNDNHEKSVVDFVDRYMGEGPYGYVDGAFDVTVKKNDVVMDVGAWIGDFSAYAVSKGATAYAFEPVNATYQLLCKTEMLNKLKGGGIYPVKKGLSDRECELDICINKENSGANSILKPGNVSEKIMLTTLDKFVEDRKLERVDFIKADIEGAERDMLSGACNTLKAFAPKLAICTYHLPDDPEVLENIILKANPDYTVVHTRHKLFAAVLNAKRDVFCIETQNVI
jgi:FkbM family methyltransferase